MYRDYLKSRYMITEKAKERVRILIFWETYGLKATLAAFKVKRRTLFNWKKQFSEGGKHPESLNEKARAPRKKRKRLWDERIIQELKRLRWAYPNLGKEKLYPLLKRFCETQRLAAPKPATIDSALPGRPQVMLR